MQTVTAGGKFLTVYQNLIGHFKLRRFIRTGPPDVTVGDDDHIFWTLILIVEGGRACS